MRTLYQAGKKQYNIEGGETELGYTRNEWDEIDGM